MKNQDPQRIRPRPRAAGERNASAGRIVSAPSRIQESGIPIRNILRPGASTGPGGGGILRRQCADCQEEELQRKELPGHASQVPATADAPGGGGDGNDGTLNGSVGRGIETSRAQGRPLPTPLRRGFESRFGSDFGGVRVVTGDGAARLNDSLNARAFTVGNHIWFGRGEYRPESPSGQRLLAHELTHTLQQDAASHALHTALRVGSASDPAEAEADRVADAVMQGGTPDVVRRHGPALRRQKKDCAVDRLPGDGNMLSVTCGSEKYQVTFSVDLTKEDETRVKGTPGIDFSRMRFELEVCRGKTRVRVTPSVDVPAKLKDMAGNIIKGSPILDKLTLNPAVKVEVDISDTFSGSIEGGPIVDVQTGDVIGGGVTLKIPLGKTNKIDCTKTTLFLRMRCERIVHTDAKDPVPAVTHAEKQKAYFLFPYAQPSPVNEVRLGSEDNTPVMQDNPALTLQELAAQGFRVSSIEGYTSPEGPRDEVKGFMGNDELGVQRAETAKRWLEENCPACGAGSVGAEGRSELYNPPTVPEPEGDKLTRAVTPGFLESDPLRPATEKEREALAKSSLANQRAKIYPLLRRARVILTREVIDKPAEPGSPASDIPETVACPDMVRQAVGEFLGVPP